LEEGFENFGLLDPEPIISQEAQLEIEKLVTIKRILLLRMHGDMSRYMATFFSGFRRMALVRTTIDYFQQAEALAWELN